MKNRDVCLIETINHITTNNCYCFFFLSMKTLCLSCFVGYHRSILYTPELSLHRFHSSFICLMCPHLMCFFFITKILNFMFPLFENYMHLCNPTFPWKLGDLVIFELCGNVRKCAEFCGTPLLPIYIHPWTQWKGAQDSVHHRWEAMTEGVHSRHFHKCGGEWVHIPHEGQPDEETWRTQGQEGHSGLLFGFLAVTNNTERSTK